MSIEPSQVRAVLFDAVGTLLAPDPSVAAAYAAAGRRHGCEIDESTVGLRFRAALVRQDKVDQPRNNRTGDARERQRWRAIVGDVFDEAPTCDTIFAELWDHFARSDSFRLYDDAAIAWQRLDAAGVTLGIASNFDARLHGVCGCIAPLDACRLVFVSSEIGWRKPQREFFRAIERQLNLPPQQILLVGDDPVNDLRAAQSAGWQALLVDRECPQPAADAIRSLVELADRLAIA